MEDNSNSQGGCQPVSPQPATQSAIGLIYKITCLVSGKIYVGRTKQKLENRMAQHRHESKKGSPSLGAAIRKHGWENFSVEILETCPVESLNEREIFWIAKLNANGSNGYNLTEGGKTTSGYSPTKETRDKISAKLTGKPSSHKGKPLSEEHKAKLSANHADFKGENHPFFGKHHSPETCAKLSIINTGKKLPEETKAKIRGRKHTPEEIAKMSAGMKAWWARKKAVENGGNK